MLYRIDGELMAMAVLDILPNCVSSVYFMYDNKWESYSMGKVSSAVPIYFALSLLLSWQVSAMREIALTREIHEHGVSDMKYLYLGMRKMLCRSEY